MKPMTKEKIIIVIKNIMPCSCLEDYKKRNITDPTCAYCNFGEDIAQAIYDAPPDIEPLSEENIKEATIDLVDKHFPKHACRERGAALVLYAEIILTICERFRTPKVEVNSDGDMEGVEP